MNHSEDKSYKTSTTVDVVYNIHRASSKQPFLVFLHGIGGDLTSWNEEREELHNKHYSTIALDLPGHGLSSHPDDNQEYTIEHIIQDIKEVLEYEGINSPVLVGHCFGGMISMGLTADDSYNVNKLVLIDTNYKAPAIVNPVVNHKMLQKVVSVLADVSPKTHIHARRDLRKYKGTSDYNIRRIISDVAHTSLGTWLLCGQSVYNSNLEDFVDKISVPTLVIAGADDSLFPLTVERELARKIKGSNFKAVPHANHIIVISNPTSVTKEIEAFLHPHKYNH